MIIKLSKRQGNIKFTVESYFVDIYQMYNVYNIVENSVEIFQLHHATIESQAITPISYRVNVNSTG